MLGFLMGTAIATMMALPGGMPMDLATGLTMMGGGAVRRGHSNVPQ